MPHGVPVEGLVGRDRLLDRLGALVARALDGERVTVFVAGEAGIGKTSLVRAAVAAGGQGAQTAWGTCIDVDGAPGYWPWSQALDGLVRGVGVDHARRLAGEDVSMLTSIVPSLGAASHGETSQQARLLLMDATSRFLATLAAERPVVVVLDDLQWADESSLALLDFVARAPQPAGVGLVGAYRHDEVSPEVRRRLGEFASRGEHLQVEGLDLDAVRQLVVRIAGSDIERTAAESIHRRTGGHPFFVRELALLADLERGSADMVPVAVRDAVERRVARLPGVTIAVLEVAAVLGTDVRPDVVAAALGRSTVDVEADARTAVEAGVLARTGTGMMFVHDLLRETILDQIDLPRRIALHQAIGAALDARMNRSGDVAPSELARHFIAAVSLDGPDRAVKWALAAAAVESAALAFGEASGHLRRLRGAVADAAVDVDDRQLVDVLLAEGDALTRAGSTVEARGLLRHARDVADRVGEPERIARVALATAQLGARFAARRDEIVRDLDHALAVVAGADDAWEARLTATPAPSPVTGTSRPRGEPASPSCGAGSTMLTSSSNRRRRWASGSANLTLATSACPSASSLCGLAADPTSCERSRPRPSSTGPERRSTPTPWPPASSPAPATSTPPVTTSPLWSTSAAGAPIAPICGPCSCASSPRQRSSSTTAPWPPSCLTISARSPTRAGSTAPSSPSPAVTPTLPACSPPPSANPRPRSCFSNRRPPPTGASVLPVGSPR